jgi:HEAT repeat protein
VLQIRKLYSGKLELLKIAQADEDEEVLKALLSVANWGSSYESRSAYARFHENPRLPLVDRDFDLVKIIEPRTVSKTIDFLNDPSAEVRFDSTSLLASLNTASDEVHQALQSESLISRMIPGLIKLLDDEDFAVRVMAVQALGPHSVETNLIKALRDEHAIVRSVATHSLAMHPAKLSAETREAVINNLLQMLRDKNQAVRKIAAEELGRFSSAQVVSALIRVLQRDRETDVRAAAATALGAIDNDSARQPLLRALAADGRIVDVIAPTVAAICGDEIIPQMRSWLRSARPQYVRAAASVLGELRAETAVDDLNTILDRPPWVSRAMKAVGLNVIDPRIAVVNALRKIGNARAISYLIKLAEDPDVTLRRAAAEALLFFVNDDERVVYTLIALLDDPDEHVQYQARSSLLYARHPAALEARGRFRRSNPFEWTDHIER